MHCSNNHGQQNFTRHNQEYEQPQLFNRRDTREVIEIGEIQLDSHVCWVKAHAGILGNEMADQLAKTAARDEDKRTSFAEFL